MNYPPTEFWCLSSYQIYLFYFSLNYFKKSNQLLSTYLPNQTQRLVELINCGKTYFILACNNLISYTSTVVQQWTSTVVVLSTYFCVSERNGNRWCSCRSSLLGQLYLCLYHTGKKTFIPLWFFTSAEQLFSHDFFRCKQ